MKKETILEQISLCFEEIDQLVELLDDVQIRKRFLFNKLRDACKHRENNCCRHEALKREADAAGCNAYLNGCHLRICPLAKNK